MFLHWDEANVLNITRQPTFRIVARQAGIVLPVALFMLLAATILTLALVKANLASLRIGGASVVAAETQANAELALNNFFSLNGTGTGVDPFRKRLGTAVVYNTTAPVNTTVTVLPRYCGTNAPRSEDVTQWGDEKSPLAFNLHQVRSVVDDPSFGSHAEVSVGIVTMVFDTTCPRPKP